MLKWNIFGSGDSLDCDVFVATDNPQKPAKPHDGIALCKQAEKIIRNQIKLDKPLNVNVGFVQDGVIVWCVKGSPDETNNAIWHTYKNHEAYQQHQILVDHTVPRDIDIKLVRTARTLLGLISRTNLRVQVKQALNKDHLGSRIQSLRQVHYNNLIWTNKPQDPIPTIWKNVAFQIGQTLALLENVEIYSKKEVGERYPELTVFLTRNNHSEQDLINLTQIKNRLLDLYDERIIKNPEFANRAEVVY